MKPIYAPVLLLAMAAMLAACGGGDHAANLSAAQRQGGAVPADETAATPEQVAAAQRAGAGSGMADLPEYLNFQHSCATPRISDAKNLYPDRQGTLDDEKTFLRGWSDSTYLWYSEIPVLDPAAYGTATDYFQALKTPALTSAGKAKDRYHFTYDTAKYDDLSRGVELGYGLTFVRNTGPNIPRSWRIASIAPGSPADGTGLRRGDELFLVDGLDFAWKGDQAAVDKLNAGLFPTKAGEEHYLIFSRGFQMLGALMKAAKVDVAPVQNVSTITTPTGKVGYLTFNNHNSVSELQLINAFTALRNAAVNDLVLDMRYNGGGLLVVASELAYMIAGSGPTTGKTFEHTINNGKRKQDEPLIFLPLSLALPAPKPAPYLKQLPTLNLKRVTILTGPGTCSASESVINSLRGVDVEVNLIGGQTCGKPYAFVPTPNCGTTYFTIQYQGVNNKGFGDYSDGFAPTCEMADDLTRRQGDPEEGLLKEALAYRAYGRCTAPAASLARLRAGAGAGTGSAAAPVMVPVRPSVSEIAIRQR